MTLLFGLLYALSGLLLVAAPFLSWKNVTVLGVGLGLPGMLWHGVWLCLIGLLIALLALRARRSWLLLLTALLLGAGLTGWTERTVALEGDRVLLQMQLRLTPANEVLGRLGMGPLEFYRRASSDPGRGLQVAQSGLGLLALTLLAEFSLQLLRKKPLRPWLLGRGRCRQCGWQLRDGMRFCPGCQLTLGSVRLCSTCHQPVGARDHFCSSCSAEVLPKPSE